MAETLTQAQVAGQIGVTKTVISSYENDLRQPSYDNLLKLASRLLRKDKDQQGKLKKQNIFKSSKK